MSKYQEYYTGELIIEHLDNGFERQIPKDENNVYYQEFLAWDAIPGNDPDPADPPPPPDPQAEIDKTTLGDFNQQFQTLLNGLDNIQADIPTLVNHAQTLSTITLTGLTLAALETQLQGTMRNMGTDLGILIEDVRKLTVGSEKLLHNLEVFVRRTIG